MKGFIVTGTDTGVGKSLVSAALLVRLAQRFSRVAGYKPIAAGCEADGTNDDVELLRQFSQPPISAAQCCPYLLPSACAPHLAAQEQMLELQVQTIVQGAQALAAQNDALVVEGAGGLLVPLSVHPPIDTAEVFAQIHQTLDLPVVLVVGMRLGCLNHALLTAEAITRRGLVLAGWVGNHLATPMSHAAENMATLRALLPAPCLGEVSWRDDGDVCASAHELQLPSADCFRSPTI